MFTFFYTDNPSHTRHVPQGATQMQLSILRRSKGWVIFLADRTVFTHADGNPRYFPTYSDANRAATVLITRRSLAEAIFAAGAL